MKIDYVMFDPSSLVGEDKDKAVIIPKGAECIYSVDSAAGEKFDFSIHDKSDFVRIPVFAYAYVPPETDPCAPDVGLMTAAVKTATEMILQLCATTKVATWTGAILVVGNKSKAMGAPLPEGSASFFLGIALKV